RQADLLVLPEVLAEVEAAPAERGIDDLDGGEVLGVLGLVEEVLPDVRRQLDDVVDLAALERGELRDRVLDDAEPQLVGPLRELLVVVVLVPLEDDLEILL